VTSDLCYSFQKIASWVWERIELAQTSGLAFSEETITETILLDLATRHPAKVKIKAFTKTEEGVNGSDWEWWIGQAGSWFGMRVQAKKIKLPAETFAPLQRYGVKKGSTVGQIDKLLSQAKNDGLNSAYCFYFVSKKWPTLRAWPVYNFIGGGPISPQGCFVADATAVKAVGKDTLAALAPISVPWHLLVCHCAGGIFNSAASAGAAHAMLQTSRQLAASVLRSDDLGDDTHFPPRSELPSYMNLLREGSDGLAGLKDADPLRGYAKERGLKGFVLIDTSEET
jgi:hypothetical protein